MQKVRDFFFLCLIFFIWQGSQIAKAEAGPYGLEDFRKDFREEYRLLSTASHSILDKSIQCAKKSFSTPDCSEEATYYKEIISVEIKKLRRNFALSRWNYQMIANGGGWTSKILPFEKNLSLTTPLTEVEPLSNAEIELAEKSFNEKFNSVVLLWREGLAKYFTSNPPVSGLVDQKNLATQAMKIVDTWPISQWISLPNPFLQSLRAKLEKSILQFSKRRVFNQLSLHPVLGYLKSERPDSHELLQALERIKRNLNSIDEDNAITFSLARDSYDFDPLLDQAAVVFSIRNKHPEAANYISELFSSYLRRHAFVTGLILVGGFVMAVLAPPAAVAGVTLAYQIFTLASDFEKMKVSEKQVFSSVNPTYSQAPIEKLKNSEDDLVTDFLTTPFILMSLPMMRLSQFQKVFR